MAYLDMLARPYYWMAGGLLIVCLVALIITEALGW